MDMAFLRVVYREFSDTDEHNLSDSIFSCVGAAIINWLFTHNL